MKKFSLGSNQEHGGSGTHLVGVDAVVDRPGGLEILQHPLLQLLRQPVHPYEVLEVLHPGVVQ